MKTSVLAATLIGLVVAGPVAAQVAGSSTLGVTTQELQTVYAGWSAKKHLLGEAVYNDAGEKIGTIEDLIITPDNRASYAIIGVGGFLGLGQREVAIPMNQLTKPNHGKLVLTGATKDALKTMPEFEVKKK